MLTLDVDPSAVVGSPNVAEVEADVLGYGVMIRPSVQSQLTDGSKITRNFVRTNPCQNLLTRISILISKIIIIITDTWYS